MFTFLHLSVFIWFTSSFFLFLLSILFIFIIHRFVFSSLLNSSLLLSFVTCTFFHNHHTKLPSFSQQLCVGNTYQSRDTSTVSEPQDTFRPTAPDVPVERRLTVSRMVDINFLSLTILSLNYDWEQP